MYQCFLSFYLTAPSNAWLVNNSKNKANETNKTTPMPKVVRRCLKGERERLGDKASALHNSLDHKGLLTLHLLTLPSVLPRNSNGDTRTLHVPYLSSPIKPVFYVLIKHLSDADNQVHKCFPHTVFLILVE